MQIPVRNLVFYAYWCWAWIVLGVFSIAGGLYLLFIALGLDADKRPPLVLGSIVIIVVGLLRIANCVHVLKQLKQRHRLGGKNLPPSPLDVSRP